MLFYFSNYVFAMSKHYGSFIGSSFGGICFQRQVLFQFFIFLRKQITLQQIVSGAYTNVRRKILNFL
jgi:hypothetical protein